jgi:hypothetical protein
MPAPDAAAMNGEFVQMMGLVINEVNDEGKLKKRPSHSGQNTRSAFS